MPLGTSNAIDVIIRVKGAATSEKNVKQLNKAFTRLQNTARRLPRAFFNLRTSIAAVAGIALAKNFNDAAVSMERMNLAMTAATGSSQDAREAFALLRKESKRLGLEFESQADGYAKLAAAAKGSKLEGEGIQEVWVALAEANTALQLTSEDSKWTLYALTQMMSKGKVTAEELRRQLGERLPGAFQIAARAIGVSTKQLDKMLEQGELISEEFLPKFAKRLRQEFGQAAMDASDSWTANMNRMRNHWFEFRLAVTQGDIFPWLKAALSTLAKQIQEFKENGDLAAWAEDFGKTVVEWFEKMIMGFAKAYDFIIPKLDVLLEGIKRLWGTFNDLPGWVKSVGVLGAIIGGKKGALAIGALVHLAGVAKNIGAAFSAIGKGQLTFGEFAKMNATDLENFLATLDETGDGAGKFVGKIEKPIPTLTSLSEALAGATTATEKAGIVLQFLRQLQQETKKTKEVLKREDLGGALPEIDPAIEAAADKLGLARAQEKAQTAMAKLQVLYDRGLVELETYYNRRREIQERGFDAELDALEKQSAAESDIKKKSVIDEKIIKLKGDHVRRLLELDQWYYNEKEKLDNQGSKLTSLMADARLRAEELGATNLRAQFANELAEMQENHRLEMNEIEDLTKDKMKWKELEALHNKEVNQLMMDQDRRLHEYRTKIAADAAGGLADIFTNLYELTGKKQREWFYLAKAAALAEAIINTSQAVTKAMAQGGIWGYAQAALITAKGAVEVSKISAQSLAEGGIVQGISPYPKADDKLIGATAGEFMQPVKAVKHYGVQAMEAIRNLSIPREMLTGFGVPPVPTYGMNFAGGGMVPERAPKEERPRELVVAPFYDPKELERFLATARGSGAVVTALAARRNEARRIFFD